MAFGVQLQSMLQFLVLLPSSMLTPVSSSLVMPPGGGLSHSIGTVNTRFKQQGQHVDCHLPFLQKCSVNTLTLCKEV